MSEGRRLLEILALHVDVDALQRQRGMTFHGTPDKKLAISGVSHMSEASRQ